MTDQIKTAVLRDGDTEIRVLSLGCATQSWQVGGRHVVLGHSDPESYRKNPTSMGIVVGRVANRTSGAQFELDGTTYQLPANDGQNHLHGGPGGVGWQNWTLQQLDARNVLLSLTSPHLDQGYPGNVRFDVSLALEGHKLTWTMRAVPDRTTPINLAQHLYFNLAGQGDIRDHQVQIAASECLPTDDALLPTGEFLPVDGTRFDFREPRTLSKADPTVLGYDLNYVLDNSDLKAEVTSPDGMRLRLWTDRAGLQLYTGHWLGPFAGATGGLEHKPFSGFCLEAQDFPNAMNTKGFGSILCSENTPYHQTTTIEIRPT